MVLAAIVCRDVLEKRKLDAVITAGLDGKHSPGSLHYVGLAFDLRTNNIPAADREPVRAEIKDALGDDYDVVIEGDHIHIECQPKKPYGG
jgi:hypothetical protein